jgi:hypothetical protein
MINQQISYYCTDVRDSSAVLDSFFVTREFENIGKLRGLEKKIEEHDYTAAESLRNQIIAENIIEQASKEVLSLYLKHEQGLFDTNDSLELLMWAHSCYNLYGKAVLMAQVLHNSMNNISLLFDEDCPASLPRSASLANSADIVLDLYPNPNSDVLYVISNHEELKEAKIILFSLEGALIFEGKIEFLKGLDLNDISLAKGVYLVELQFEHNGNFEIHRKKLLFHK